MNANALAGLVRGEKRANLAQGEKKEKKRNCRSDYQTRAFYWQGLQLAFEIFLLVFLFTIIIQHNFILQYSFIQFYKYSYKVIAFSYKYDNMVVAKLGYSS